MSTSAVFLCSAFPRNNISSRTTQTCRPLERPRHARILKPDLPIIARAHADDEVEYLEKNGANAVVMGEREIANRMLALS